MIGLAADNVAVMMGKLSSVQARFREMLPNLFCMGCVSHSFHSCSSGAVNKLLKSIEEFAPNIYKYFSNSSKRQKNFTNAKFSCK